MNKMKKTIIGLIVILLIISLGFVIQISAKAPDSTRVIIDHIHEVYVSPPCFDQAELTNYLEETTLGQAVKINYEAEGSCTEQSLMKKDSLIGVVLESIGVKVSVWEQW